MVRDQRGVHCTGLQGPRHSLDFILHVIENIWYLERRFNYTANKVEVYLFFPLTICYCLKNRCRSSRTG